MHYSVYEGMQNTWSDRFDSVSDRITAHNWLPAGVAGLVVLWIGLIFAAMQVGSQGPGTPSDLTATRNNPPMAVTAAGGSPTDLRVDSAGTNVAAAQPTTFSADTEPLATTPTPAQETPLTPLNDPIIGGRGGGGTGALETPSLPAAPEPTVGLEVDTPVTEPIGVDVGTNDGLQAGVDLGGLLDVDLDVGLGL
ncbi:MAG TPA: hypothetical protein VGE30_00175 [Candidatus Saccharimonadales bacterium]